MTVYRIPIPSTETPIHTQRTSLDGVSYRIDWRYNARIERWIFDLYDGDDVAVVTGRVLVSRWPLLNAVSNVRRPPGELILTTSDGEDPDIDTIEQATLRYYDAEELGRG